MEITNARAITCPRCNAVVGGFCKRADNKDYRRNGNLAQHVERIRAWNAAGHPKVTL